MAAVSSLPDAHHDDVSLSAVHSFLQRAVSLYRVAVDMHRDDDAPAAEGSSDESLKTVAPRIKSAVLALQPNQSGDADAPAAAAVSPPLSTLPGACYKVGRDLIVHIDRLNHLSVSGSKDIDIAEFRLLWPAQDVAALGVRLLELGRRYHDVDPTFSLRQITNPEVCLPASALLQGNKRVGDSTDQDEREVLQRAERVNDARLKAIKAAMGKLNENSEDTPIRIPTKRPITAPDGILHEFVLENLAYKSMRYREQEVTRAHTKTFEWVFSKPKSATSEAESSEHEFSAWLRSDDQGPIYWITGKPGSGKSTFIRFLFDHESTQQRLEEWAGDKQVCTAGFFFWTSGSREQRSQTGLLRSLLHQLLSANPEFTKLAFPQLWKRLKAMTTKERVQLVLHWSTPELMGAFQAFVDAAVPQIKICLFVDGLDEFEGDHVAIIDFFKNLSLGHKGKLIKMCLSSRPWQVFQDAFQYAVPNLRLQDLTYEDMYRYTRDRLRENVHIRRLLKQDSEAGETLITSTVRKSDGVFLWVRLALNEMMGKFDKTTTSGLGDLAATLTTLPMELYELFPKFLFDDQTDAQVAKAAVLFQLMRAREVVADFIRDDSANSLTIWELAFALEKGSDDELASNGAVEEASDAMVEERCTTTMDCIRQRFAGLLDLHARRDQGNLRGPRFADRDGGVAQSYVAADQRVTYIHRTVRDWLMEEPGVLDRLVSYLPVGFDAHLRLLRSYVLRLKRPLEEIEHHRRLDEWWPDIALAMTHARYIKDDQGGLQSRVLNELNRTLSWYWLRKPQDPYDHWARSAFGAYEVRMMASPIWQPFLCLATKFGITRYIQEEVLAGKASDGDISDLQRELQTEESTPLLAYATEFLCSRNKTIFPVSDPQLVEFLLGNTCRINPDTNHEYKDFVTRTPRTPWIAVLRHLRDARRRGWIEYYDVDAGGTARWARVVRLFLEVGGADAKAVVLKDVWDPEVTALGVLELLEETYGSVELRELKQLVVKLGGEL